MTSGYKPSINPYKGRFLNAHYRVGLLIDDFGENWGALNLAPFFYSGCLWAVVNVRCRRHYHSSVPTISCHRWSGWNQKGLLRQDEDLPSWHRRWWRPLGQTTLTTGWRDAIVGFDMVWYVIHLSLGQKMAQHEHWEWFSHFGLVSNVNGADSAWNLVWPLGN